MTAYPDRTVISKTLQLTIAVGGVVLQFMTKVVFLILYLSGCEESVGTY